ncbi:MAG TPA: DUF5011 domain-containing protein [Hyalangium sp.]|nr:DUF5011 domain-containing protein [Hyalangium sp.]
MACGPTKPAEPAPSIDSSAAPLLSTSPEISVPPFHSFATMDEVTPAVAAGNGVYLVAWKEFISTVTQILAVRVRASDGAVLDAAPILIDSQSSIPYGNVADPAVAFDGSNFLVVYSKLRPSNISYREDIFGKRVRASDGAVLDTNTLVISSISGSAETRHPSVIFNGSYYLVLWETLVPASGWSLFGSYVLPSGQVLAPSSFPVAPNGFNPRLAAGTGANSMGAWSESPQGRIRVGWFFSNAPQALLFFTVADSGGSTPAIAYDGTTFLVVWNEAGGVVKARRVRLSQVQGQPFSDTSFTVGQGAIAPATVSADSQSFRVTYEGMRDGAPQLLTTRVLPDGTVAPGAEQTLSALHPSTGAERPAFASLGPAQKLVAYKQYDPAARYARIKVRLVSDVSDEVCTTGQPALLLNGEATLTLECGSGSYVDPGARAFDGCGYPMPVTAYNTGSDSSGPGPNTSMEGTYAVSYAAWDATGSANVTRTVVVEDRTPPALTLLGPASSTHTCGSQWVDPGVQALDTCYGDVSAQVWRTGEVNGWAEGTYTVTYTLTDSGGNSATPVERVVEVVDCPW